MVVLLVSESESVSNALFLIGLMGLSDAESAHRRVVTRAVRSGLQIIWQRYN